MARMTLDNESVTFKADGIYIQPVLSDRFRFDGSADELISIMINHPELNIENVIFRVIDKKESFYISPFTYGY